MELQYLEQCIEISWKLVCQMEYDCDVPKGCLGGKALPIYEKLKANQLSLMKKIDRQLHLLKEVEQIKQ